MGKDLTYNQRLEKAGIKTIYPENYEFSRKEKRQHLILLEFEGKQITRPSNPEKVSDIVLREFNIVI